MPSRRRQRHCFAPGCETGYHWKKGEQPSLFAVPKDEARRKLWERNLHRKDRTLDESCSVCELHFEPSCVLRDYVHVINGEEVRVPRGRPELTPDAVPTLLPNAPSYLSKKASHPRLPRKRKNSAVDSTISKKTAAPCADGEATDSAPSMDIPADHEPEVVNTTASLERLLKLCLPSVYWSSHRIPNHEGVVYCKLKMRENEDLVSERAVIFSQDGMPGIVYSAYLRGRRVEAGRIFTCEEAETVLRNVDLYRLCRGALSESRMPLSHLTKGLQLQVVSSDGMYYSKRCNGKEASEGVYESHFCV